MAEQLSRYLQMSFDSNVIGAVTSIQLQISNNIINITNFDSGDWQEKMKAGGDWTMTVGYNTDFGDTGQEALGAAALTQGANGPVEFGPAGTPATGDVTWTGEVIIESLSVDASDPNQQITQSVSFSGNGELTRAVAI